MAWALLLMLALYADVTTPRTCLDLEREYILSRIRDNQRRRDRARDLRILRGTWYYWLACFVAVAGLYGALGGSF